MTKAEGKVRYLVSKPQPGGKVLYYWQPAGKLRDEGFLPRRLSDDFAAAVDQAGELNRELDEWRTGSREEQSLSSGSTLSDVVSTYRKDPLFTEKAFATQRIYEQCLERIEQWAGDQPIGSISRGSIIEFHRILYARKPAFANAIGRMMRIIFEFAYDRGLIESNPARRLKMQTRPPRHQIWTQSDQDGFLETAHEMGYASVALAFLLAVCTAQRQGDILKLCWTQYADDNIRLRQSKTGRWIRVPVLPELKAALDVTPLKSEFVVCSESTGEPYKSDYFRHLFREIATKAGLKHLQFRDLRRTAIVRLAEAGVSTGGITAISGHDIAHCESILETYMPRNSEMAREAMTQYETYRRKKAKEQTKVNSWKKSRN